jgi:hypothetical protein
VQFGVPQQYVNRHYHTHVSARYKQAVAGSHNASFEKLLADATKSNSETLDVLNLAINGHVRMYVLALEAGDHRMMSVHSARIYEGVSLRSKITMEIAPPGGVTINAFVMRDAVELMNTLQGIEGAPERVEDWYRWRTQGRLIEAEANVATTDQSRS